MFYFIDDGGKIIFLNKYKYMFVVWIILLGNLVVFIYEECKEIVLYEYSIICELLKEKIIKINMECYFLKSV